jgi:hypothetical protein
MRPQIFQKYIVTIEKMLNIQLHIIINHIYILLYALSRI